MASITEQWHVHYAADFKTAHSLFPLLFTTLHSGLLSWTRCQQQTSIHRNKPEHPALLAGTWERKLKFSSLGALDQLRRRKVQLQLLLQIPLAGCKSCCRGVHSAGCGNPFLCILPLDHRGRRISPRLRPG